MARRGLLILVLSLGVAACAACAARQTPSSTSPAAGEPFTMGDRDARVVVAAVGDSIAAGTGSSSPSKSFPAQLATRLNGRLVNVAGDSTVAAAIAQAEVPRIPLDTTLLVIDVGSTDVSAAASYADPAKAVRNVAAFERGLDTLVASARARVPQAKIVLVTVRSLGRAGVENERYKAASLDAAAHAWNAHEKSLAARSGIAWVVDTESDPQFYLRSEYEPAGIHPNDAGAARLANAIAQRTGLH